MANEKQDENPPPARPEPLKLTVEESLRRMQEFEKRKARIVAAVRKSRATSNVTPPYPPSPSA